jgi:retron-type reverse transcriptase
VREIQGLLNRGYRAVVDCDLSGYFDSIPHHALMKSVARRVSDGALLALIKAWLEMPVEEDDGHGGKSGTIVARDSGRGTPQGAPISPLLSNLYLRRFVLGWKQRGCEARLKARVVVYADDFRHPMSRNSGTGPGADAEDHERARADGEREENAHCPRARGVL